MFTCIWLAHGGWSMNKKGIELMEEVYMIESLHVDKMHCICKGPNARITFMEEVPEIGEERVRASVTMDINSFFEMVEVLNGVANQVKEQNKPKEDTSSPKDSEQLNLETKH